MTKIDQEQFLNYYYNGLSDTKISKKLNIHRKVINQFRKSLNLPRMSKVQQYKSQITDLVNKNYSDAHIAKTLKISKSMIGYIRKKLHLKTNFIERTYSSKEDRIRGYMIRNIKFSAKRRGLEFNLDYKQLQFPKNCPILGIPLSYTGHYQDDNHATVDRIDNTKGYILGNVMIVSRLANAMKNSANFDLLNKFCENIPKLIMYYKNQGALGNITDVFPEAGNFSLDS